jgi:hypothetical protein
VADKRCENGHFIDEAWDLCPYCPAEHAAEELVVVHPARTAERPAPASAERRPAVAASASMRRDPAPVQMPAQMPVQMQVPPMERTVAAQRVDSAMSLQQRRYVVGWLVGLNGSIRGESFPVRMGRNVLGRDRKNDVSVNDDQASAHHADLVFRPEERRFILMDHNSTNGTYVNEVEIEPRRDLAAKDVIRIGSHRFLFMPLCADGFFWDDEGALQ